jgi:uroporphyrinogen-III synthase
MAVNGKVMENTQKRVKSILISQPKPERSPYAYLEEKYNLQIDWRPFIHVEGVTAKEYRKQRLRPTEFSAVIFTAKNAVDHFFRIVEEMRLTMPQDTKYFCLTEAIANYLQKFIVYRKRKVFFGKRSIEDLSSAFKKNKGEKFLLPCSNLGAKSVTAFLTEQNLDWTDSLMYRTVSSDLSDLSDVTYDILVFFSPLGISSLYENFPTFKQNHTRLAVFGNSTTKAVEEHGLEVNIRVRPPEVPSMTKALEIYLKESNPDQ